MVLNVVYILKKKKKSLSVYIRQWKKIKIGPSDWIAGSSLTLDVGEGILFELKIIQ